MHESPKTINFWAKPSSELILRQIFMFNITLVIYIFKYVVFPPTVFFLDIFIAVYLQFFHNDFVYLL